MSSVPRPMSGTRTPPAKRIPWWDRKDSAAGGGNVTKGRAEKPLPSEVFDWSRALEGYARIRQEVYGGEA